MVRPDEDEERETRRSFMDLLFTVPLGRTQHTHWATQGEHRVDQEAKDEGVMASAFIVVSGQGRSKAGQASLGFAFSNDVSWLWGIGTVPEYLVPGSEVIKVGIWWPRM